MQISYTLSSSNRDTVKHILPKDITSLYGRSTRILRSILSSHKKHTVKHILQKYYITVLQVVGGTCTFYGI